MFAVCLGKALEAKLAALARAKGRTKSELARDAIVRLIEDDEDLEIGKRALRRTRSSKPLRQLLGCGND